MLLPLRNRTTSSVNNTIISDYNRSRARCKHEKYRCSICVSLSLLFFFKMCDVCLFLKYLFYCCIIIVCQCLCVCVFISFISISLSLFNSS